MYEEVDSRSVFVSRSLRSGFQLCGATGDGTYRNRYHLCAVLVEDAKGDFVGFDIDLGNEMCKRMQVKCTWVASDFDALIPSLKAKKSTPLFRRSPLPINVSRRLLSPTSCTPQILV